MSSPNFRINVAAVIEQEGRFLLVEEQTSLGLRLNQPGGSLELNDETLQAGVVREMLEETAHDFTPEHLVGVYRWRSPSGCSYLRFAFAGRILAHYPERSLDRNIVRTVWLTADEIRNSREHHRSPAVLGCMEDYLLGKYFPMELLSYL